MRLEPIPEHLAMTVSMILALHGLNLFTAPAEAIERALQQAQTLSRQPRA